MPGLAWRRRLHNIIREVIAITRGMTDKRVPWPAKAAALLSLVYLILPLDIIPDFIPVIGWMDDLAMVPLACYLAGRMMPQALMEQLRRDAEAQLRRWGPRLNIGIVVFVFAWIMLASLGGWMMVRNFRETSNVRTAPASLLSGEAERTRMVRERFGLSAE